MLSVSLITLGDPGTLTGGYLYHLRMAEVAHEHDARIDFVSFPAWPFPLPAAAAWRVAAAVRRLRPDVVALDSIAAGYAAPVMRRLGAPVVAVMHQPLGGIDHGPLRARIQALADRAAYRNCRLLICASEALAEEMRAQGFQRIRVVPPGRDAGPQVPPAEGLRAGRRAAVLCVANWLERKDVLSLLEAVAKLPEKAVTLHLAGDEEADPRYAARVRERLAQPDLAGRVVRHGRVDLERVMALYGGADVFALPARAEPYGTVWGEAMACGLPVVGWRAGNLPHLATHGKEGLMVPVGDVDGLSDALRSLAYDEDTQRRLGGAARARAATRPTWEEAARMFFQIFRQSARQ